MRRALNAALRLLTPRARRHIPTGIVPDAAPGRARSQRPTGVEAARGAAYPGDFTGRPEVTYVADPDGQPDPGEVVWTWVPYEEDHSRGKDRPVLLIGRDGGWLLALPLTSRDHDRDAEQERSEGREWVDIGSGDWDRKGRPSEVGVHRILRIDPSTVRREGAILSRERFDEVAAALRSRWGA
ncbi:type II toxin-antitoxin system PemK/MazF family toxin [Janibacter sp. G1551]|uniref:type II toxin-antitoxin system PemK/MazF family toxin n=1 Tax=Janibacter sp. G1551 TaxID=3420440 RepID=UPI003CFFB16C